ncbi:uncharacterized protein LOC121330908 isoform X1 [Polyodon spathula]|uniref:uncharacterized protein LOC121330908 isoform X1 n=1 Tax=Polyodon spathula TaxID=7913 RepID=UPI001B7E7BE6|nr:uncharacterized protein LOC121330908 isoform X1 [Polyodon spathula]
MYCKQSLLKKEKLIENKMKNKGPTQSYCTDRATIIQPATPERSMGTITMAIKEDSMSTEMLSDGIPSIPIEITGTKALTKTDDMNRKRFVIHIGNLTQTGTVMVKHRRVRNFSMADMQTLQKRRTCCWRSFTGYRTLLTGDKNAGTYQP